MFSQLLVLLDDSSRRRETLSTISNGWAVWVPWLLSLIKDFYDFAFHRNPKWKRMFSTSKLLKFFLIFLSWKAAKVFINFFLNNSDRHSPGWMKKFFLVLGPLCTPYCVYTWVSSLALSAQAIVFKWSKCLFGEKSVT